MKKSKIILLSSTILLITLVFVSLSIGNYKLTFHEIIQTLLGNGTSAQNFAIYQLRLPRIILAIVVAFALSFSGGILQTITKNPLAEPGVIGINTGAALFVVILISSKSTAYYSKLSLSTTLLIPIVAIVGAMSSILLIYIFAYKKDFHPIRFILAGIGINAGFSALISFYQLSISKGDYNQVLTWISGSLWGSNWNYILLTFPIILLLIIITLIKSKTLDVIILGDELSYGIGVNVQKEIIFFLITSSFLAALATSVAGNIAFLGFLGPQIAKKIIGNSHNIMLPLSGIISSIILIISDAIAKNLFSPIEIPIGIIVSILGVPYFIFLIIKNRRLSQ